jgi:hypothetical protein
MYTPEHLKEIAQKQFEAHLFTLGILLNNASRKYIDDIPTVVVSGEEKKMYDNICTVIDVAYSNEKGFVSIYIIANGFIKLKLKPE